MDASFVGTWTYRSLINDPILAAPFEKLEFGRADLVLTDAGAGTISGTIGDTGWSLALAGTVSAGPPTTLRFQGRGEVNGEPWAYDYLGFLAPNWSIGVDQVAAIVGSTVRAVTHSGGNAKAG